MQDVGLDEKWNYRDNFRVQTNNDLHTFFFSFLIVDLSFPVRYIFLYE